METTSRCSVAPSSRLPGFVLLAVLGLGSPLLAAPPPSKLVRMPNPVPNEYMVVLERGIPDVAAAAHDLAARHGAVVLEVWPDVTRGFFAEMNSHRAEAMTRDPRVMQVIENSVVHSSGSADVGGGDPRWNLDRLDQRSGTDDTYQYCGSGTGSTIYVIDAGVDSRQPDLAQRLQQGPNLAVLETNPPYPDSASFSSINPCGDRNRVGIGHGTAVATIAAGSTLGVARTAKVTSVRFMNCNSFATVADWIRALRWLRNAPNAVQPPNPGYNTALDHPVGPAIVNLSNYVDVAANAPEQPFETEIRALIDRGFMVVVSANNQNTANQATLQMPARLSYSNTQLPFNSTQRVISAGGTKLVGGGDVRWICASSPPVICAPSDPGSNYGLGVDMWAPAYDIQSGHIYALEPVAGEDPWPPSPPPPAPQEPQMRRPMTYAPEETPGDPYRYYARSGTSFAAPLIAGVLARIASEDSSIFNVNSVGLTQDRAWSRLRESATLLDSTAANLGSGSTNRFIYAGGNVITLQPTPRVIESSTSTTLSATATGTNPSYTLYAGASGTTTTLVAGPQSSGSFNIAPAATTSYWIRAASTCTVDNTTVSSDSAAAILWVLTKPVLTVASASATQIALTWTGAGPDATSYEVYRRLDGQSFGATPLATTTGLSYTDMTVVAGTTYNYKIVARHGTVTGQVESAPVTASATATSLVPPMGVSAIYVNGSVLITWNSVIGADGYLVERKVADVAWTIAKTVTGATQTSTTDVPSTASGVVLYRVRASSGSVTSAPSNNDVAYAQPFTDEPILTSPPYTTVRAIHIIELRRAVNGLRAVVGEAPVYTGSALDVEVLRGQAVDDSHFILLMNEINNARALPAVGLTPVGFRILPVGGGLIDDTQIEDLRKGVQ